MRIGIDCRTLSRPLTGIQRYLANLLREIVQVGGPRSEFILFFDSPRFPRTLEVGRACRPVYVPFPLVSQQAGRNWMAPVWLNTALVASLRRQELDVCFFPNVISPLWGPCSYVVKVWDMSPYVLRGNEQHPIWGRYVRMLLPRVVSRAARVIVPSYSTRAAVSNHLALSEAKMEVIYEGVDPMYRVIPTSEARQHLSQRFGLTPPFVLHVGQITSRKNLPVLLQAFRRLTEQQAFSSHRLVLAGGCGHGGEAVTDAIRQLDLETQVLPTGRVSDHDLLALYNAADVFAFPSLREGFGLPILEAMACGIPVIASNTSSLPEVVGDAGILVDPSDVTAWADALQRVLQDAPLRTKLRAQGLERAKRFSWSRTADQTLRVLRSAASAEEVK